MYAVPLAVSPLALPLLSPTRVPNLNTMDFRRYIVVFVIFVVNHAAAQGTNATCLEGYDWVRFTTLIYLGRMFNKFLPCPDDKLVRPGPLPRNSLPVVGMPRQPDG